MFSISICTALRFRSSLLSSYLLLHNCMKRMSIQINSMSMIATKIMVPAKPRDQLCSLETDSNYLPTSSFPLLSCSSSYYLYFSVIFSISSSYFTCSSYTSSRQISGLNTIIPSDAMPKFGVSFPKRPISSYCEEKFQVLIDPF